MYSNWRIRKSDLASEELGEQLAAEQQRVADWCNAGNEYCINDDEEYIYVEPVTPPSEEELKEREIIELREFLAQTDYVAIKIAEGAATAEDYADVLAQRRAARQRINELEGE